MIFVEAVEKPGSGGRRGVWGWTRSPMVGAAYLGGLAIR